MSCPDDLKPVDGECPVRFPFKFVDMDGGECCYKQPENALKRLIRHKKRKMPMIDYDDYVEEVVDENGVLPGRFTMVVVDVDKIATMLFIHTIESVVSSENRTVRFSPYLKDLYYRNITPGKAGDMMKEFETWMPDDDWVMKQLLYAKSETAPGVKIEDLMELYSKKGDRVLNMYIRNGYSVSEDIVEYIYERPYEPGEIPRIHHLNHYCKIFIGKELSKDTLEEFCVFFYDHMNRAVSNSPKLDSDLYVFRGVENIDHFDGVKNHIYVNSGIMSTSVKADVASEFSYDGYMTRIKIPAGYKALFRLAGSYQKEMEIILPDRSKYYITREWVEGYNECVLVK